MRKILFQIIKILLGILLLYFSIRSVDWLVFRNALMTVSPGWFLAGLLSVLFSLGLKISRWALLLKYFQIRLPWLKLITAFFMGQAANILFVFRAGELVRIGSAHQAGQDDVVEHAGAIALEKYLDLVMFVVSLLIVSTTLPDVVSRKIGAYQNLVVIASILLLIAILLGPWTWKRIFSRSMQGGWFGKLFARVNTFIEASMWLRHPGKFLSVVSMSMMIWLVMGVTNWLLFKSLGLSLGWQAAGLVVVLVYVGVLPALMPGNLGPFTYFAQLALLPFAVESSAALAFAVILYAVVNLPVLLFGRIIAPGTKDKTAELDENHLMVRYPSFLKH